jgi:hypothetical protein
MTRTIVIAGLLWSGLRVAHAQVAVDSVTADLNAVKDLAQQVKGYAVQAQQYVAEAEQLDQLVNTFNALVQNPEVVPENWTGS